MTVGRLKMNHLAHLLEPLKVDDSLSVQAAAIYGLKRCGYNVDLNPLATFLMEGDAEVKSNAALVLGELGNPSAIPLLQGALGKGLVRATPIRARIVDLQIAEAMVKLGADTELDGIRAALFSPVEQAELTALAALICGRVRDAASVTTLQDLAMTEGNRRQPPEIRLAATMALAQIDRSRAPREVPLSFIKSAKSELRAQAALTLGYIGGADAERAAFTLLSDPDPLVQLASAGAVLNMQSSGGQIALYDPVTGTAGSIDTNQSPRYKKELSQVGGDRR
jgi:HEAT repeat protein